MKRTIIIFSMAGLLAATAGCDKKGIDDDLSFTNSTTLANAGKLFDISNDNSGNVKITPTGEGATSYVIAFGNGTGAAGSAVVTPGNSATHAYPEGTYTVTITSKTATGQTSTATYPLTVTYRAPENIVVNTNPAGHVLKVTATAKYAASFVVYFGDVPNEVGTPITLAGTATHTYAAGGIYTVKVVALSGGAATAQTTTSVTIFDPLGLPLNFDQSNYNYFFGTFGTGQQFAQVANPNPSGINTSAQVGKFTRGNESWSGTYTPLDIPIDMAVGKKIKVWVYNPDPALIGKNLNVELETGSLSGAGTIANGIAVLKMPLTTSGAWEELVFDYSTIAAIPAGTKFGQLVLRFNDAADGPGAIIYVDNFRLTN